MFDAEHLEGVDHVNSAGAQIYTARLAEALASSDLATRGTP